MTDITLLAQKLYQRMEWQSVPEEMTANDLKVMIADGIRDLYVMTGRSAAFHEDLFVMEYGAYAYFAEDLQLDECAYVLVTAEIA